MDLINIISEFQIGLILNNLDKPNKIIISTYDIDLTLFILEFYDPNIDYYIYYWIKINDLNLPKNIHLIQLNNNHCKFWYIETKKFIRFIITSSNLTNLMVHNCLQSYYSITVKNSNKLANLDKNYNQSFKQFFDIYNLILDYNLYKELENKLLFNIPNKINLIEKWYKLQKNLIIDCNNINLNYLPNINKKIIIRTEIPPNLSNIICYYSFDKISNKNQIINIKFNKLFHYKLYYTDKCVLLSSNNFSYNHKKNLELGIIINGTR